MLARLVLDLPMWPSQLGASFNGDLKGSQEAIMATMYGLCRQVVAVGAGMPTFDKLASDAYNGTAVKVKEAVRRVFLPGQ